MTYPKAGRLAGRLVGGRHRLEGRKRLERRRRLRWRLTFHGKRESSRGQLGQDAHVGRHNEPDRAG